jgi:dihydrofolate reductase
MRNVIVFNMITADGYFESLTHGLDWHNVDAEFNDFAIQQLEEADTLVFGRRTYEMMASFWPSEIAQEKDPVVSGKMSSTDKLVFSHSLKQADWQNTTLLGKNAMQRFAALKEKPGKALLVLGSSNLCVSLLEAGLIDELRLMVNPVVLGKGNPIFAGLTKPLRLSLTDSRNFKSGNVLLRYSVPKE